LWDKSPYISRVYHNWANLSFGLQKGVWSTTLFRKTVKNLVSVLFTGKFYLFNKTILTKISFFTDVLNTYPLYVCKMYS